MQLHLIIVCWHFCWCCLTLPSTVESSHIWLWSSGFGSVAIIVWHYPFSILLHLAHPSLILWSTLRWLFIASVGIVTDGIGWSLQPLGFLKLPHKAFLASWSCSLFSTLSFSQTSISHLMHYSAASFFSWVVHVGLVDSWHWLIVVSYSSADFQTSPKTPLFPSSSWLFSASATPP